MFRTFEERNHTSTCAFQIVFLFKAFQPLKSALVFCVLLTKVHLVRRWRRVDFPVTATIPAPRSGHQMAVHGGGEQIFLYGGWSKVWDAMWLGVIKLKI